MEYFTIKELTSYSTADKCGIDNTPTEEVIDNLNKLVDNILDPARRKLGDVIIVNSGYRCEELNRILMGAKNSQHIKGEAADIYSNKMDLLLQILKELPFDQLIIYKNKGFIHVSYSDRQRRQILYK